jgi:hypothetical protein
VITDRGLAAGSGDQPDEYRGHVQEFEATIHAANGGGTYVEVPPEVVNALGGGGRIPVLATFDGID